MNTTSHFLITAWTGDQLKQRKTPVHLKALLWGSVFPDLPLFFLTLGYFVYRTWFDPIGPGDPIFGLRYDNLYFYNPFWIASHNLFHAPPLILFYTLLGYYGLQQRRPWGAPLFWFALACGFHSFLDILTHHNDGPLLFFPFNWYYRFLSPVSYWHPAYYGRTFGVISLGLDLVIVVYFGAKWLRRRKKKPGRGEEVTE